MVFWLGDFPHRPLIVLYQQCCIFWHQVAILDLAAGTGLLGAEVGVTLVPCPLSPSPWALSPSPTLSCPLSPPPYPVPPLCPGVLPRLLHGGRPGRLHGDAGGGQAPVHLPGLHRRHGRHRHPRHTKITFIAILLATISISQVDGLGSIPINDSTYDVVMSRSAASIHLLARITVIPLNF